jgi:hypothetical protein
MTSSKRREPPSGRIRSLHDAERLLDDDLPSQGVPRSEVRAVAVCDPDAPMVIAEFAARLFLTRKDGRLVERRAGDRVRRAAARNLWWIAYGSLVYAEDGSLVIGSFSIAPQSLSLSESGDVFLGVTADLLRVVSPARIIADAVRYLRTTATLIEGIERFLPEAPRAPEVQKEALRRIEAARIRPQRVPDDEIAALAARYVTLYRRGNRRPTAQLAAEFGLTATQVRDRVHRARHELGFLTPGKQGRAGAEPTPKLLARWSPGTWTRASTEGTPR